MSKKKILITGGCGFVGTNLALYFSANDFEVICVDNLSRPSSRYNTRLLQDQTNVIVIEDSVQNCFAKKEYGEDVKQITYSPILKGVDCILNCAAQSGSMKGFDNPLKDIQSNFDTVVSLCEYSAETKTPIIHWSTNKVYGNKYNQLSQTKDKKVYQLSKEDQRSYTDPFTRFYPELQRGIYGCTKYLAEVLLMEYQQLYNFPLIINRFSCLAGPYQYAMSDQGWLAQFVLKTILNEPISLYGFGGNQVRDILHIDDLTKIIEDQLRETEKGIPKDIIRNIGGGSLNATTLNKVITICTSHVRQGSKVTIEKEPRPLDQNWFVADNESLGKDWKPTKAVDAIIEDLFKWSYQNLKKIKQLREKYSNDFH